MYRQWGVLVCWCLVSQTAAADWPQFRGPEARGVSRQGPPPASWQESPNIAWRADLPGRGPSSPIVVGGRIFLTSSDGASQDRLLVLAIDAETGRHVWRREFWATGRTITHPMTSVAAPTPASDGNRVFAFYSSNDLVCLDLEGNLVWYRGLGYDWSKAGNDAGMASSPVVVADTVVVQIENQGESFAAGIHAETGETRWRIERQPIACWCTPVALPPTAARRPIVLLQSSTALTAHDATTGAELWSYEARCSSISSLVANAKRIFLPSNGMTALELAASDRAPTVAWQSNRLGSSGSSPLLDEDRIYVVSGAGVLNCADASDGKIQWQLRIPNGRGAFWSTPVIVGDRLYCFREDGTATVVKLGTKGELIGTYAFGEPVLASPAVGADYLLVRSDRHLWKVAGSPAVRN